MSDQNDYDRYRAMLPVMKHRLDDELEVHPQIYEILSSRVVLLNSRMLDAKHTLAVREGRLAESMRDEHTKMTKAEVENKVQSHPDYKAAWERYQAARSEHERWSGLLDAWRQKGYAIKTLAELYSADYYSLGLNSTRTPNYDEERSNRRPIPPSSIRQTAALDADRAAIRRASNQATLQIPSRGQDSGEDAPPRRRRLIDE